MPTETDVKLAEEISEFRLETEKRFGSLDRSLAGIERDLKFIRWIGAFFAGTLTILVGSSISIAWNASAIVSEVRYQGRRLDELKERFDSMETEVKHQGRRLDSIESEGKHQGQRLDAISRQIEAGAGRAAAKAGG